VTSSAKQKDTGEKRARILLVDDHAVVRYGIAQLINQQADMMVCGEEEDASKSLAAISILKPNLVITDISLKESSGLGLMRNIQAQHPGQPVLVMSVHDESIYAEIAFRAGALGYLMKGEAIGKILTAIRQVLAGSIYVSETLGTKMLQHQIRGQADAKISPMRTLSDRELEVLQLIGLWKGTRQIAEELHLSIKTIEYYRDQIKKKLDLKNASELTQYATSWIKGGIPS
jgi:DNA-binding NarL/FixJ family response regulator